MKKPVEISTLEDGLFSVVMSLCQIYIKHGFTKEQSRELTAELLESIATTLKTIEE